MITCTNQKKCRFKSTGLKCLFVEQYAKSMIEGDLDYKRKIIKKCCQEVRNIVLEGIDRTNKNIEYANNFLSKCHIGEKVYCTFEIPEVVLLSIPDSTHGDCEYLAPDGTVKKGPVFCFSIISESNLHVDHKIKDELLADHIEVSARRIGARTQRITNNDGKQILQIFYKNKKTIKKKISEQKRNIKRIHSSFPSSSSSSH